jgi:hypothetical protein
MIQDTVAVGRSNVQRTEGRYRYNRRPTSRTAVGSAVIILRLSRDKRELSYPRTAPGRSVYRAQKMQPSRPKIHPSHFRSFTVAGFVGHPAIVSEVLQIGRSPRSHDPTTVHRDISSYSLSHHPSIDDAPGSRAATPFFPVSTLLWAGRKCSYRGPKPRAVRRRSVHQFFPTVIVGCLFAAAVPQRACYGRGGTARCPPIPIFGA